MGRTYQYDAQTTEDVQKIIGSILLEVDQAYQNADYTQLMAKFLNDFEEQHENFFSRDAGPSGESWPPLKPYTIAKKGHDTILEDTLVMKKSVTQQGGDAIRSVSEKSLLFGSLTPYAIFHQRGTRKMPKREFIGTDSETVDRMANEVADATVEKLKL